MLSGSFCTLPQPRKGDQRGFLLQVGSLRVLPPAAVLQRTEAMATTAVSAIGLQKCGGCKALWWASGAITAGAACERASNLAPTLWRWWHKQPEENPATCSLTLKEGLHHLSRRRQLSRRTSMGVGMLFAFAIMVGTLLHRSQRRHPRQRQRCRQQAQNVAKRVQELNEEEEEEEDQERMQPESEPSLPGECVEDMESNPPISVASLLSVQQEVWQPKRLSEVGSAVRSSSFRLLPALTCTSLAPAPTAPYSPQQPGPAGSPTISPKRWLPLPQGQQLGQLTHLEPAPTSLSTMQYGTSDVRCIDTPKSSPKGSPKGMRVRQLTEDIERRCVARSISSDAPHPS